MKNRHQNIYIQKMLNVSKTVFYVYKNVNEVCKKVDIKTYIF